MKIAVVTETFHPFISGTAKRYFEVFRRIAKQGHNVHVFTARMADSWPIFDEVEGIYIHRTKKVYSNFITQDSFRSTSDVLDFSLWSSRQILQDAFDVVEATHCPLFPLITSYLCKKLKGFPLVATFHEVWYNQWYLYAPRKIYAPFGIALEGITAKIPDMAVAVSNMTAERLISCFGYPKDKVIVIPNGVDLDFCKSISVTRNKNTIIYAGRLNTHKKIEWLLEAYFIIKKKKPQLELRIVGDGPALSRYVKFAKDHDLIDVYFTGQVDYTTFLKEIKSAGIFVLTSIREGQSIVIHEAMACGTPQVVVKSADNAAAQIIKLSGSGLVAEPNPTKIAEAIEMLLDSEYLWIKLQKKGLDFIQNLDWNNTAENYLKLYKSLKDRSRIRK